MLWWPPYCVQTPKGIPGFAQPALNVLVGASILSDNAAQIGEGLCAGKGLVIKQDWCWSTHVQGHDLCFCLVDLQSYLLTTLAETVCLLLHLLMYVRQQHKVIGKVKVLQRINECPSHPSMLLLMHDYLLLFDQSTSRTWVSYPVFLLAFFPLLSTGCQNILHWLALSNNLRQILNFESKKKKRRKATVHHIGAMAYNHCIRYWNVRVIDWQLCVLRNIESLEVRGKCSLTCPSLVTGTMVRLVTDMLLSLPDIRISYFTFSSFPLLSRSPIASL